MQVQPSDPMYKLKKKQQNPTWNHYGPVSTAEHTAVDEQKNGESSIEQNRGGVVKEDEGSTKPIRDPIEIAEKVTETETQVQEDGGEEDLDDFFASLE